ncbi:MAG: GNAT family N-acetyltransferase [Bacillota bacterium]
MIRLAGPGDEFRIAEIFAAAFADSISFYAPGGVSLGLLALWPELARRAEPEALLVKADAEGTIQGYIFSPSQTGRLWRIALTPGYLTRVIRRLLEEGLPWRRLPLGKLLGNKLWFWRTDRGHGTPARILSLAVDPGAHGRGYGRELLAAGLSYLRAKGCPVVTLEVRPDNAPARQLYQMAGFAVVGETRDAQGPWIIMQRDL